MKRGFLVFGLVCTLAALVILSDFRTADLIPNIWKRRANSDRHGEIDRPSFSPDGKKLIFMVSDESGNYSEYGTYLCSIPDKTTRKLPIGKNGRPASLPWVGDSKHIAFREQAVSKIFNIETDSVLAQFRLNFRGSSPDGKKHLFQNYLNNDKYLRDVKDGNWTVLPEEARRPIFLYWTYDSQYLVYGDWERKAIMRYGVHDANLTELMSFKNYHKSIAIYVAENVYPSPKAPYVYVVDLHGPSEILKKVHIRSGQIVAEFDLGSDLLNSWLRKVCPARDDTIFYCIRHNYDEEGGLSERWTLVKLDTVTGKTEVVLEGPYSFSIYSDIFSEMTETFAVQSEDRRTLYLFRARIKTLEQVFPTEETA